LGPTGICKSTAVAARLWQLRDTRHQCKSVAWAYEPDLIAACREHRLGAGAVELVDRAINAHVLVLDDVGKSVAADAPELIERILDERYRLEVTDRGHRYALAVTSGRSESWIINRYGEAAWRRMTVPGEVVDLLGGSNR
jgi:hypothetical protein